jgi:hypothetical protein
MLGHLGDARLLDIPIVGRLGVSAATSNEDATRPSYYIKCLDENAKRSKRPHLTFTAYNIPKFDSEGFLWASFNILIEVDLASGTLATQYNCRI